MAGGGAWRSARSPLVPPPRQFAGLKSVGHARKKNMGEWAAKSIIVGCCGRGRVSFGQAFPPASSCPPEIILKSTSQQILRLLQLLQPPARRPHRKLRLVFAGLERGKIPAARANRGRFPAIGGERPLLVLAVDLSGCVIPAGAYRPPTMAPAGLPAIAVEEGVDGDFSSSENP